MKSFIWNYFDESISPSILFIIKESFRKLNKNFKQNYFSQYVLPFLKFLSYPHFVQLFFIISIYIIIKKKNFISFVEKGRRSDFSNFSIRKKKKKKKKFSRQNTKLSESSRTLILTVISQRRKDWRTLCTRILEMPYPGFSPTGRIPRSGVYNSRRARL